MMDYADEYAAVDRNHWWFLGRQAVILAALRRFAPVGSRLLDVGCGTGGLTAELARWYEVEAVDPSPEAVSVARGRGLNAYLLEPERPWPAGFDLVCAFDVLEHVDDDVGMARNLAGAARDGGLVAVTVPAWQSLWGPMDDLGRHRRRYRLGGLTRVMRSADIGRIHATYFNALLFPAIVLARLVGLPRPGRELGLPPRLLNRVLGWIFASEAQLLTRAMTFPVGTSILFLGRRAQRLSR